MIIHTSLENIPQLPKPVALAIGNFDGVHLGHQHLLQELKKQGTPVVLTFSNHPSEILRPEPVKSLFTLTQKLQLLEKFGVAMTIIIPFTQELSETPYDVFLKKIPFDVLVAGEDIRIGARGEGTASILSKHYKTVFLPKFTVNGIPVSSRYIREHINEAQQLLGHSCQDFLVES